MLDDLIGKLSSNKKLPILLFLLLAYDVLVLAFNNLSMVFHHADIPHHCKVPEEELNISLPLAEKPKPGAVHPYSSCEKYKDPYSHSAGTELCQEYYFYIQDGETSIVSEWSLVCDKKYLPSLIGTLYFTGMAFTSALFGYLADRIGRKVVILGCFYLHVVVGVSIYFVTSSVQYAVLKTIMGGLCQGLSATGLTLLMEYTRTDARGFVGNMYCLFWPVGALFLGGLAYFIHDWRYLQLATIAPFGITCIYIWLVPESIRWTLATGRIKTAQKTLKTLTTFNNIKSIDCSEANVRLMSDELKRSLGDDSQKYNFLDLLKTPQLRTRTLIIDFIWFSLGLCYYGILFGVSAVSSDKYGNFLIGSSLELVGNITSLVLIMFLNRKTHISLTCAIASVTCIIGVVLQRIDIENDDLDFGLIAGVMLQVSKGFVIASFAPVVTYSPELFPTVVRTMGYGTCIVSVRVASLLGPQMALLGYYTDESVPFIVFAILPLISLFLLCLYLPETRGAVMPDTIADVEYPADRKAPKNMQLEMKGETNILFEKPS